MDERVYSHKEQERQEVSLEKFLVLKKSSASPVLCGLYNFSPHVRHPKPQCSNSQRELPCEA